MIILRSLCLSAVMCCLLWNVQPCDAQPTERQSAHRLVLENGEPTEMKYLKYLPPSYDGNDEKWPLLLFLHGAGERGDDLEMVKVHGPPKMIDQGRGLSLRGHFAAVPGGSLVVD